jgi:hypothetical protein
VGHPDAEGFRQLQCGATLAAADAEVPEAPDRAELVVDVTEAIGDLQRGRPGCDRVGRWSLGLHERDAERGAELHLPPRVPPRPQAGLRLLGALATFGQERQLEPERHRRDGEGHPNRGVAGSGEGPVQGGPHVVDTPGIEGQPLGGGARRGLALGPLEQVPIVLGVAPRHLVELAALGELLERVGARRLEQPVSRDRAPALDDHERLPGQVGHGVHDSRAREVGVRRDGTGRIQQEATREDGEPMEDGTLGRRQQLVAPVERGPERLVSA